MTISAKSTLAFGLLATGFSAVATPLFDADSILVSSDHVIHEYALNGDLLSTTEIPENSTGEQARDLVVLENGHVAVFNGTFVPELSIYDGTQWNHQTIPGWSIPANVASGGITQVGNQIFLTDGYSNGGEEKGLIAYDMNTGVGNRFIDTSDYIDITLGADNLLYALRNAYGDLDVIDPVSYAVVKSLDLGHSSSSRAVTANQAGEIFMASWSGYVAQFDPTGQLLKTLTIGGSLMDIDINESGQLLVGSRFGAFHLIDSDLLTYSSYAVDTWYSFVGFATPIQYTATPEAPILSGSHYRHGRNIYTTLNWVTEAGSVDVYYNGNLLETVVGDSTATYAFFKKHAQVFMVCNAGTEDCSATYVSN